MYPVWVRLLGRSATAIKSLRFALLWMAWSLNKCDQDHNNDIDIREIGEKQHDFVHRINWTPAVRWAYRHYVYILWSNRTKLLPSCIRHFQIYIIYIYIYSGPKFWFTYFDYNFTDACYPDLILLFCNAGEFIPETTIVVSVHTFETRRNPRHTWAELIFRRYLFLHIGFPSSCIP